ncbi:putative thiolase [Rhodococcus wratislaviensis]|uniref:Putative thiolase n=2 Tax=Nocardiaceae TaxID=85025 RepID=A0A402CF60_RHOWR|nr:putative thiolase [Rhodococcus wratislaviensis]
MDMVADATRLALADAGIEPAEVAGVVTEASLTPKMAPIGDLAPVVGLDQVSVTAMSSPTGAGILQAIGIAAALVESGTADHVVSYFGIDWGTRSSGPNDYHAAMDAKSVIERPAGFVGPPLYFAAAMRRYGHVYGLSDHDTEDLLASIAMAARANATLHPGAQVNSPLTREDYDRSPMIASPVRKADCCLLSDGAVAVVVSNSQAVSPRGRAVSIRGWSWAQDRFDDASFYSQSPLPLLSATARASEDAFRLAGVAPANIDVAEIYDCFSPAIVLQLESAGFCAPGSAAEYTAAGALKTRGEHPTNTHGGLLSHGYLFGANHLAEAVTQLRHEAGQRQVRDAELAFVGAGPGRQYTALILEHAGE